MVGLKNKLGSYIVNIKPSFDFAIYYYNNQNERIKYYYQI